MRVNPEDLVDGGLWISDDRVYAFVSARGIEEIGYHGAQPVSRNSRVFAGPEGVLRFALAGWPVRDMDWLPGSAQYRAEGFAVGVTCTGRRIVVAGKCPQGSRFMVLFDPRSLFVGVHGHRTWEEEGRDGSSVTLRFTDSILLNEWMDREGPYSGDFLIPEPLRRTIFARRCRSGLATKSDVRQEYRGLPLPVQEGQVRVQIGGNGYALTQGPVADEAGAPLLRFEAMRPEPDGSLPPFVVAFDEAIGDPAPAVIAEKVRKRQKHCLETAPVFHIEGYPHVEQFFSSVPAIVESAIVKDLGFPRACPGRYYWIWAWDAAVTAGAGLSWGDARQAEHTARFIDAHRDVDGRIPMQWTRTLAPLDTQDPGSLDTLLYALAYAAYLETGDLTLVQQLYPRMVSFLDTLLAKSDVRGCFANIGFYPDLPRTFGRGERSAVAMEVAGFYTFCRTCEDVARLLNDHPVAARASAAAITLESSFLETFWDARKGFLVDAIDMDSGARNESFPLFSLLFLHSPLGLSLIRGKLKELAAFICDHHLTPHGIRLLPSWDRNATAETVAGAWYPHWDAYALKILRRAGRSAEIVAWLRNVENTLARLGYAPEFLRLDGLPDDWSHHGAASNLNCATGWYSALVHGVCGLESDPGGLTLLPLNLPLGRVTLSGVRSHGATWNVVVSHGGPWLESLRVDGEELRGCLKIPSRYHDGGEHLLEVRYGTERLPVAFSELTNAEVVDVPERVDGFEVDLKALGRVEVVIGREHRGGLWVDGKRVSAGTVADGSVISLDLEGEHTLRVEE